MVMSPGIIMSSSHQYNADAHTLHLMVFDIYIQVLTVTLRGNCLCLYFVDQQSRAWEVYCVIVERGDKLVQSF